MFRGSIGSRFLKKLKTLRKEKRCCTVRYSTETLPNSETFTLTKNQQNSNYASIPTAFAHKIFKKMYPGLSDLVISNTDTVISNPNSVSLRRF